MPQFRYDAENADGARSSGRIEADSLSAAAALLEGRGLRPISIAPSIEQRSIRREAELGPTAEAVLAHRDALLPPLRAYLQEAPGGPRRGELQTVVETLEGGDASHLEKAIRSGPAVWSPVVSACSGDRAEGLGARLLERTRLIDSIRRRRLLALSYPMLLLALVLLLMWPLANWVIPQFESIFSDFRINLPGATQLIVAVANLMRRAGFLPMLGLAALVALLIVQWERWRPSWVLWILRLIGLPTYGPAIASAEFARVAADYSGGEASLDDSVRLAATSIRRRNAAEAQRRPAIRLALQSDLTTSQRNGLLRELSAAYADRAERSTMWVHNLIGPVTVLVIGGLVGLCVLALFLPLVSLVENLS